MAVVILFCVPPDQSPVRERGEGEEGGGGRRTGERKAERREGREKESLIDYIEI